MKPYLWYRTMSPPAPEDKKIKMLRRATTTASEKFGTANQKKPLDSRRKITLPKLKFLDDEPCQ